MSLIPFGFWAASGAGAAISYWLSSLGGSSNDTGKAVTSDSDNNVLVFGDTSSSGAVGQNFLLSKYDALGEIQWQRTLGLTTGEDGNAVTTNAAGDVYISGVDKSDTSDLFTAKYNSSGTLQWQRSFGGAGNQIGEAIKTDSLGNVYSFGYSTTGGAGSNDFLLLKYNSSGVLQWQRVLGGTSGENGKAITIDLDNNIYVFGTSGDASIAGFLLAKYNTSGTIQWQRGLGGNSEEGNGVATDSSGNIFVIGYTSAEGAGSTDFILAKYNTSGTLQWQKIIGGTGFEIANDVAVDSDGNIYAFGRSNSSPSDGIDFLIVKYNTAGEVQWQRILGSSGNEFGFSIFIDSSDAILAFGHSNVIGEGNKDFFLAKLPNDGSLTGTYSLNGVDVTYAASSLTAGTSTLTAVTSSLTATTSTLAERAGTLTGESASLTAHFVQL